MTSNVHHIATDLNMPFSKREAYKLLDKLVHRIHSDPELQEQDRANMGVVVGMLLMNDEVEIVIKYFDGIKQYTKSEVEESLHFYDD